MKEDAGWIVPDAIGYELFTTSASANRYYRLMPALHRPTGGWALVKQAWWRSGWVLEARLRVGHAWHVLRGDWSDCSEPWD